ncbi:MAG: sialate O-acetylesterase, partial [Bacteroidales bacterium]|nr:sialate O-acetylesterase [Bacteroidales bacterium]
TYKSVEFEGNVAHVSFNVDGLGLCPLGAQIQGFEIAGADKMFYPASAWLRGGSVIDVTSPEVPEPVAVRYCFRNWCIGGLYNNFGVPAGPFRTDDWQL